MWLEESYHPVHRIASEKVLVVSASRLALLRESRKSNASRHTVAKRNVSSRDSKLLAWITIVEGR